MLRTGEPLEKSHESDRGFANDAALVQFTSNAFGSRLIHFIKRDQSVFVLLQRDASLIENAGQYLPMIYANDEIIESKSDQGIACRRDQFSFNHHGSRAEHVNIALIEFAEAPTRGTIGTPHRLNLV